MNFKKMWSDPVWSKVISAGILFAISTLALYASVHWWAQVRSALLQAWMFTVEDVPVQRWLFWVLTLCVAVGFARMAVFMLSPTGDSVDERKGYKEDVFLQLRWRWRFDDGHQPSHIYAFCPVCDFQLDVHCSVSYFEPCTTFECSNCHRTSVSFTEPKETIENRVARMVQLALRNGSWKQASRMKADIAEQRG